MEPECCGNCRFFGRTIYPDRDPPGQCCRHAPGAFTVEQISLVSLGKMQLRQVREIPTPFPAVNPHDYCGEYEGKDEPATSSPVAT